MLKLFNILMLTFGLMTNLFAQTNTPCNPTNVYIQKHDGSGRLPFSGKPLDDLKQAAIELAAKLPQPFCNSFKVYDYGFTPALAHTKLGLTESFEAMKLEASGPTRDQAYLLFAREVNESNQVKKIWIDVNLPKTGGFACMTEMQRSLLKIRVENAVTTFFASFQEPDLAEQRGMSILSDQIKPILDCCANSNNCKAICPTADEMKKILEDNGFVSLGSIRIKDRTLPKNQTATVENAAMKLDLEEEDIEKFAEDVQKELVKRKASKIYIIDDAFYCKNEGFAQILTNYKQNLDDYDVVIHLTKSDDNGNGEMWVKIEGEFFESDNNNNDDGNRELNSKNKKQITQTDVFLVGYDEIPPNTYLHWIYTPIGQVLAKPVIGQKYQFDRNHYVLIGPADLSSGAINFTYEDIVANQNYNIFLAKKVKGCTYTRSVVWNTTKDRDPKSLKNISEGTKWETTCNIEKQGLEPKQLALTLQKIGANNTYFKYTRNGKTTYISKAGETGIAPNNFENTIFEIKEDANGRVAVDAHFKRKMKMLDSNNKPYLNPGGGAQTAEQVAQAAEDVLEESLRKIAARHGGKINPKQNAIDKTAISKEKALNGQPNIAIVDDGISILYNLGNINDSQPKGITYKPMNLAEILAAAAKAYNDLVEKAKIPVEVWEPGKEFPVRDFTGVVSGVGDQVIEDSKDLAGLVGMALTVVTDPAAAYDGLKGFVDGFAGNPWDMTKKLVTGVVSEGLQIENFQKGGGYARYASGRVGVTIVKTAIGASFLTSGASFMDKVKDVPKQLRKSGDDLVLAIQAMVKRLTDIGIDLVNANKYAEKVTQALERFKKKGCDDACGFGKIGCLTANTKVQIDEGYFEPIATLQEGQRVSSYNFVKKIKESKPIIAVEKYLTNQLLIIALSSGNVIEATPNHIFYAKGIQQEAKDLHIGDTLFTTNGKVIKINNIFAKDTIVEVYNLRIADNNNYLAGEDELPVPECLVKAFAARPTLAAKFDALDEVLQQRFIDDFAGVEKSLLDLLQNPSKNAFKAWEKLAELVTDKKLWISKNEALLRKLDADPGKIDKIKDYYDSHTFPDERPKLPDGSYQAPPFTIKKNVNGVEYNIEYDEFGHPKFEVGYANVPNREYKPTTPPLDGGKKLDKDGNLVDSKDDYENAAQWFVDNNPNAEFPKNTDGSIKHKLGIIVDGKYYTMHHLPDGKTIVPVLGELHDAFRHTGGASVIRKGLQGFFE